MKFYFAGEKGSQLKEWGFERREQAIKCLKDDYDNDGDILEIEVKSIKRFRLLPVLTEIEIKEVK